ncbi:MAG: phosphatidate cytidylyltransferase [Oscillospiraceae bacterium]|nr:phosphatidate cytidylyltransferase [Oscillospiraceae bacterium]
MKTRILSACVLVPFMIVLLYFLPVWALTAVMAFVTAGAAYELLKVTGAQSHHRVVFFTMLCAAVIPVFRLMDLGMDAFLACGIILALILFAEGILAYGGKGTPNSGEVFAALFGGLFIPLMLSVLVELKEMPEGRLYVFLPFVATILSDSGAYFVGVSMGKHKGVLKVSPNKSAEGFAGSVVCGILGMLLAGLAVRCCWHLDVKWWPLLLYGLCGNIATQLGDLTFSLIKREHGVKDYGKLIPGHGGILDRFDSLVFAAPVIYLLVRIAPAF